MINVVTIKNKIQLYKGEEPANAIELLSLVEFGFEVVSAKDRFKVGDKAILIEPDYNLPDNNPLFTDWVAPGGDPKKSKLGSRNRIRAVKFNLHRGDGMPVYSNGILLQLNEVPYLSSEIITYPEEIAAKLGIYKYQAPESSGNTGKAGANREFPQGLYKTDEERFDKVNWQFPLYLVGTEKLDGSSCLEENTLIDTEEGKQTIKALVDSNYSGKVLSYNVNTQKKEFKPVLGTLKRKNLHNWFKIKTASGKELVVTEDHQVYLPNLKCYRQVKDLVIGDSLEIN